MKYSLKFITVIAIMLLTGCAQTISQDVAVKYAAQISDNCKLHAAEAATQGYEFIPTYTHCIDDALLYLETKRKSRENKQVASNVKLLDVAELFAKEASQDRVSEIAQTQWKKL